MVTKFYILAGTYINTMVREIKEELHKVGKNQGERKIKLLKAIISSQKQLCNTNACVEDYDYYKIVERNGNNVTVICWDEDGGIDEVFVFIGTYEEVE